MKFFGEKIRTARKIKGMKVCQLAERVGISAAFLTQIERGYRNPSPEVAKKLSDMFDPTFMQTLIHEIMHLKQEKLQRKIDKAKKEQLQLTKSSKKKVLTIKTPDHITPKRWDSANIVYTLKADTHKRTKS